MTVILQVLVDKEKGLPITRRGLLFSDKLSQIRLGTVQVNSILLQVIKFAFTVIEKEKLVFTSESYP